MIEFEYDDSELQKLFAAMSPEQRLKALKKSFSKEARRVRKVAVENLRLSINSNKELEKGIRSIVFRKKAGFRITIGTKKANSRGKGERGFYISRKRKGKKDRWGRDVTGKPVLIFAELGASDRSTKNHIWPRRKGHSTGSLKGYLFMRKTQNQVKYEVTENVQRAFMQYIMKTSRQHGCK